MKSIFRVIVGGALLLSNVVFADPLTLPEFMEQVKTSNASYKASALSGEAAADKASDTEVIFQPTIFANVQSTQDKKELPPVAQRGSQTNHTLYQGGVTKLTEWGTAAKLYYTTSNTTIKDTDERYVPEPSWYDSGATLEISHPLLKNSMGGDLRKSIELQKKQSEIAGLTEGLKRKMTLTEAEGTYWRLVLSRESVRSARENIGRARKIVDWNRRRVRSELADSADLIQAEALKEVRDIELTMAMDEERAAAHAFNTARGHQGNEVSEELIKITPELIGSIPTPARTDAREDVKAAETLEQLADLGMGLAGTKYDPALDVFASTTLNGRDGESRMTSMTETTKPKYLSWTIGLKLSAPLGGDSANRMRGGWAKEKEAATLTLSRKRYENDREWSDLNRKLAEAKTRLQLVERIEATQKRKLEAEQSRQTKGRSTMFQVTQYESDYAQAQLNVIRNKAEILGIIARMKTFGGEG